MDKGLFGWLHAVVRTKEPELVDKVGLDAALFMRFTRMLRNIFTALTAVGVGILLPLNLFGSRNATGQSWLSRLTPMYSFGSSTFWAYIVVAYLFDIIICYFVWRNYRAVLRLRRAYFDSDDYQRSRHARTLLLTDIPSDRRSDAGIVAITDEVGAARGPHPDIARHLGDLPELVEEHVETVHRLEKHLARYLKNPHRLPAQRPTCKVNKKDSARPAGHTVDAIEYLTARITELETEIQQARRTVKKGPALSYGFATYLTVTDAHAVAATAAARKRSPHDTIIRLAARSRDLIWPNLRLSRQQRARQNIINNLWVALLTIVWVVPNVLIAIFLSNLSNLGAVWPAFQTSLYTHTTLWGIVQGVAAPAITTLFYFYLPAIFRRLVTRAGDVTRTGRERHVMHKLFSFFIFNNLIVFSLFSTFAALGSAVLSASSNNQSVWDAIQTAGPFRSVLQGLVTVSPYWCAWLLQRNLGAAIDLAQLVRLTWGAIQRRWLSPTPRELIALTLPQPFDYASYYNYFLFYMAVALCFGPLQPLALAITCLYFWLDSFAKKYMLLYIFATKYESGGMFWRSLINRVLICAALGNAIILLLILAQAVNVDDGSFYNIDMLIALVPLPFLLAAFKWYCRRTFDQPIHFYATAATAATTDPERPAPAAASSPPRPLGHPALQRPLILPMVAAKSQHLLPQLYTGRLTHDPHVDDDDDDAAAAFSLRPMPSAPAASAPHAFDFVPDADLRDASAARHRFRDSDAASSVAHLVPARDDDVDSDERPDSRPDSRHGSAAGSAFAPFARPDSRSSAAAPSFAAYAPVGRDASPAPSRTPVPGGGGYAGGYGYGQGRAQGPAQYGPLDGGDGVGENEYEYFRRGER